MENISEKRVYPSNPNKYACYSEGTYYKCTYDDFSSVYFNHFHLESKNFPKIIKVEVPRFIPPFLHNKYLDFHFMKKTYIRGDKSTLYTQDWDKTLKEGKCYLK